jgi:hypothetical protein
VNLGGFHGKTASAANIDGKPSNLMMRMMPVNTPKFSRSAKLRRL